MEKFGRRSEDNRREGNDLDCQLFVRNIPVSLSKDGLYNIFNKAGTVINCKLMPPKESHFATTYGFVTYANKTEAATAVEMFTDYKVGGKYLFVKLNNNRSGSGCRLQESSNTNDQLARFQSNLSNGEAPKKLVAKKTPSVIASPSEDDIWSEIDKTPKMRKNPNSFNDSPNVDQNNNAMLKSECNELNGNRLNRAPAGRGALLKNRENKQASPNRRGNFDLSRPYARRLSSRRMESESNDNYYRYGQSYSESVRQILDFDKNSQELVVGEKYRIDLVHVITPSNFFVKILSTVPKVSMNLNEYYRNGQHEENNTNKLERGSIRCRLHNLVPTDGKQIWHPDTTKTLEAFKKTERNNRELLIAKVYSCDEFKSDEGRFEKIYGIDIYFGGEESVITYFIDEAMAVKSPEEAFEEINTSTTSSQDENTPKRKEPLTLSSTSNDEAINEPQATSVRPITPLGSNSGFKSLMSKGAVSKPLVSVKKYITIKPIDGVKLLRNEKYKVSFQAYDQDSAHVYLTLFDRAAEEQVLCQKLQEPYSPEFVTMLTHLPDLQIGDKIEALFDLDQKWYRACVTNILVDRVQVHFLDYGNSESILASDATTKIRFRKSYKNAEEEKIFSLEYQALKCVYANKSADFVETLLSIEDFETNGFDVMVKEIAADGTEFLIYCIIFAAEEAKDVMEESVSTKQANSLNSTKSSTDFEVEKSLAQQEVQSVTQLKVPNLCSIFTAREAVCNAMELERDVEYNVSISHIVDVTEFYVQSPDNLADLMDHQERIQDLAEAKRTAAHTEQESFHVGDFVLINYAVDQCWYKGVITAVNGELCNVYLVDYGNTESDIALRELHSTASLCDLFSRTNNASKKQALDKVLELPFQAICCQLQHKKESTRNTEILKTLMSDCFNFSIKVQAVTTQNFDNVDEIIKKNIVNLYSDGKLLDENFEDEIQPQPAAAVEKIVRCKPAKFEIGSVHAFSLASFSAINEIYLHQMWQVDILNKLQTKINKAEKLTEYKEVTAVAKGDAVLAKFYEDDRVTFSWYRAVVLDVTANNEVSVFFTDYGNVDGTLLVADLKQLPEEFSFSAYSPYGHHISLNKVSPCLDDHGDLLTEYLTSEGYHFKVIDNSTEVNGETLYSVELWDNDMTKCLNALIDPKYQIAQIEAPSATDNASESEMKILRTSLNSLADDLDANELCVSTEYIFIENFQKPFYFCLKKDMADREKLKQSLNQFYESQRDDLEKPQVNDFCAVQFEESWYRAQFKKLDSDQMYLFYLDYGFEEVYDKKAIAAKVLDKKFYSYPRYVFGACLLSPNLKTTIDLDADFDMSIFDETFEKFFSANSQEHTLKIRSRLLNTSSEIFVENVVYYGVQLFNSEDECLNEMIFDAKNKLDQKLEKPVRPELIRLTATDLPKQSTNSQTTESDIFRIFSRRIDLFYVFEESRVKRIQNHVKDAVDQLLEDQKNYICHDEQEKGFYNIGDFVFGKNEDDQTWYRCLITNRNKTLTKFELFFVDFGNTEIMPRCDVLCGWDEKQISVFRMYEPQAFQCKLYGLQSAKGTDFDEAENKMFREQIKNKLFNVTFVNHLKMEDAKSIFEIVLYEADANNRHSVNQYLVANELAAYVPIPKELVHKEIIEFWIDYLQTLPMNSKQFL